MSERFDTRDAAWPLRPWIMAAICSVAGLFFNLLTDLSANLAISPWRQAGAAFVAVAAVSFVLTVEQRRWLWSLGFALGWGAVVALVGWFTASYNQQGEIFEFPFLSGVFAVLLAAPLFQTVRDEDAWRFPYARLHSHAWTDAVIGAASLLFVAITFLLAWLIAGLFDVIGIAAIKDLLKEEWFGWMLAGFAFGAAAGLLRERDSLVGTLQRLVMVVLSVLAPVLAVALAMFLLSIPFTGLSKLWDSSVPATPLMLVAAAGGVLLVNAVIGNGQDDRADSRILRGSALILLLCVLPLAVIAAVSLGQRIGQYGWTPERMWGVVAVAVAIIYGAAGWWTVAKNREGFDDLLRPLQTKLALGLCGLALFLALPILDIGAVSARSQLARLEGGKVSAEEFDWAAMAFDFGPAGRNSLQRIAASGPVERRQLAVTALKAKDRHRVEEVAKDFGQQAGVERRVLLLSPDIAMTPIVRQHLAGFGGCKEDRKCAVLRIDSNRLLVVWHGADKSVVTNIVDLARDPSDIAFRAEDLMPKVEDLRRARIEIRTIERRQVFVDGKPAGDPFK